MCGCAGKPYFFGRLPGLPSRAIPLECSACPELPPLFTCGLDEDWGFVQPGFEGSFSEGGGTGLSAINITSFYGELPDKYGLVDSTASIAAANERSKSHDKVLRR